MVKRILFVLLLASVTVLPPRGLRVAAQAQGGDQFLDGIGETALVARYVLAANVEDSSRNAFHATLRGAGGVFVEDPQFGRALQLTGSGDYVQLPGRSLAGEETLSVTGWLFLPTGASGPFFDFGRAASARLFAGVTANGFRASVVVTGGAPPSETPARSIPVNQWVHLAVVLDPASHTLTSYVDGARAGQANLAVSAAQVIDRASGDANQLSVGRSQDATETTLHGRLRDVRIYRIALSDQ